MQISGEKICNFQNNDKTGDKTIKDSRETLERLKRDSNPGRDWQHIYDKILTTSPSLS